ncbi:hypothetical protein SAMN05216251_105111 [Actinacidiphila alni]|uniref:Pycsar effector protein domain-containing protein n=1 Tax=Actinacidiphila alni TaxID=380248 RepID=A0A1I2D8C5_9ACTN|nr:Pycsar system effector family protein [Actinacidiphila alni]SFE76343.1 hypothetical protein SAMN05216251_105111 [Actinacidiphila alni]
MTTAAGPEPASVLYVAEHLLDTARADLARSDTKAAVLLSSALAIPALLLGGRWSPGVPGGAWLAPLVLGGLLYAAGTGLLVWALLPRTGTVRTGPGVTFFADTRATTDQRLLAVAVAEAARDRVGWLVTQFMDVSLILTTKYRCLKWGVRCLAPGLILSGLALSASG